MWACLWDLIEEVLVYNVGEFQNTSEPIIWDSPVTI